MHQAILIHLDDKILPFSFMILSSLFLRFILQAFGQHWITTKAHTATLVFLPMITFVITKVISGNIALSLGMVGALSIVRFRNPVRSPLELSVYFFAITLGISASVSFMWLKFLVLAVVLSTFILIFLNFLSLQILKKPFFSSSFSEGNHMSTIEIECNKLIDYLDNNINLTSKTFSDKKINYVLSSTDFQKVIEIEKLISNNKNVIEYQIIK